MTLYPLPLGHQPEIVRVDEAGRTTKATRFEMRVVATKFIDTYTRDNPLAQPRLVGTKEVTQ
jgi:hypothetical protein